MLSAKGRAFSVGADFTDMGNASVKLPPAVVRDYLRRGRGIEDYDLVLKAFVLAFWDFDKARRRPRQRPWTPEP